MYKFISTLFLFSFFAATSLSAQKENKVFTTKFTPYVVTYNGSPNPHECWESVEWGIEIKVDKSSQFFVMDNKQMDSLKIIIGDSDVQIEVMFYDKPDRDTGALGEVVKISLNGTVIWKE